MHYILFLILTFTIVFAEDMEESSNFFDAKDGQLDVSGHLSEAYGFLPVPTIITEPAIGFGAAVGLLYLHDNFVGEEHPSGRNIPPSMSGVIVAATENGTKAGGGFHMGHWKDDTIRTMTVAFYYDINIDLYTNDGTPLGMNGEGTYLHQSLKFRMGETDLFLGGSYTYGKTDTTFGDDSNGNIPLNDIFKIGSMALTADYDSRDNTFSPNKGMMLNFQNTYFREDFGGDENFERYKVQGLFYQPIHEKVNLDLRANFEAISGDEAPFFMFPFIDMRGIPAMRYQAEKTALIEAQLRWEFLPRWSALVFGGVGKAFGEDPFNPLIDTSFSDASNRYTKGVGFRYLIAKKYGLRMGVDIAASQEDEAIYLQFGTAWQGF